MIAIPAIDILDGHVVRVKQGEESTAEAYSIDPLKTAQGFFASGAKLLHIVDLDSALHGDSEHNRQVITEILEEIGGNYELQLAGGIRSKQAVETFISKGASRVVVGSLAFKDPAETRDILEEYGRDRIVLALDYDALGCVRTGGWKDKSNEQVESALKRFAEFGFKYFLVTSVQRDGMLSGPDFAMLQKLLKISSGKKLIASGGISSLEDLQKLEAFGISEAIIGKAIYERKISDLRSLFKRFAK